MKNSIRKTCLLLIVAVGICMPMAVFAEDAWVSDSNAPDWWTNPNGDKYTYEDSEEEKESNETSESTVTVPTEEETTTENKIVLDENLIAFIVIMSLCAIVKIIEAYDNRTRPVPPSTKKPTIPADQQKKKKINPQVGIKDYLPHMTEASLNKDLARKFISFEEARMNFDYDKLHLLCDNELYKSYKTELEELEKKKCKRIISKINPTVARTTQVYKENDHVMVKMFFTASFGECVINTETGEVIEGNKEAKKYNHYELYFKYAITSRTRNCPNCGSELKTDDEKCYYCHALINDSYEDFVLTKVIKHE